MTDQPPASPTDQLTTLQPGADRSPVTVPLAWITAALDEIFELRQLCAYEAVVRAADLSYATFPKSRRAIANSRMEALRRGATGHAGEANEGVSYLSRSHAFREAGADPLFTRATWEAEKPTLQ